MSGEEIPHAEAQPDRSVVSFADADEEFVYEDTSRHPQYSGSEDDFDDDEFLERGDDDDRADFVEPDDGDIEDGIIPAASSPSNGGSAVLRTSLSGRRPSFATDLSTGKMVECKTRSVQVRSKSSRRARSAGQRFLFNFNNFFTMKTDKSDANATDSKKDDTNNDVVSTSARHIHSAKDGRYMVSSRDFSVGSSRGRSVEVSVASTSETKQYCLRAVPPVSTRPRIVRWLGFGNTNLSIYESSVDNKECGLCGVNLNPNQLVINFLHGMFRKNFTAVVLNAVLGYFVLTVFFGLLIWAASFHNPDCIVGDVGPNMSPFIYSFCLSWQTFSTVGYGAVRAAVSTEVSDYHKCIAITAVVSTEAFVGLLFTSVWVAIIFIKVSRVQSFAQVDFSDLICIRYGTGIKVEDDDKDSEGGSHSSHDESNQFACPILEFRVVNQLWSIKRGEIIDASINVVASIDADQACPTVAGLTSSRRRGSKRKKGGRRKSLRRLGSEKDQSFVNVGPSHETAPSANSASESLSQLVWGVKELVGGKQINQPFDEDPSGHLVPRRILSKLQCESHDHPFFKRVFTIRHKLDHHSPLLKAGPRQMVKQHQGFWPSELNSAECVRGSIHFDQLLISLTGTSNADANSVYAQKVYDYGDVNVGYQFVNMLYRDPGDGSLNVDMSLINDVLEQVGGGAEEFQSDEKRRDILAL